MKITFIGGGNMGEAILSALIKNKVTLAKDITVSDTDETRRKFLAGKYGINISRDNVTAITDADVIVFAVKPQVLTIIMPDLKGKIKPEQLMISIIAGARVATLKNGLTHTAIARSMPNTPAQIGEGMTVWTATREVTATQRKKTEQILSVLGKQIYVEDEKFIDMATAVSGSGPAYLFYFVEALIDSAVELGFTHDEAKLLVLQTVNGAVHLLSQSGKETGDLRQAVTSPGGTTAAAIKTLDEGGFKFLIAKAIKAAYERAKEIGK